MTIERTETDYEQPDATSPTDHVLTELQLHGYRSGGVAGVAEAGASAAVSPLRRAAAAFGSGQTGEPANASADGQPDWAQRMKRAQTVRHGASAAGHAVRSGDHGWERRFRQPFRGGALTRPSVAFNTGRGQKRRNPAAARLQTGPLDLRGNIPCSNDLPFITGACPNRPHPTKRQRRSGMNALDPPAYKPKTGA